MVELAVLALGCGPAFPSVRLVKDVSVFLAIQRGLGGLVLLKIVEIFEEQQPGSLLRVIELSRAASFFAKDVVDVFEGLFEHILIWKVFSKISAAGEKDEPTRFLGSGERTFPEPFVSLKKRLRLSEDTLTIRSCSGFFLRFTECF